MQPDKLLEIIKTFEQVRDKLADDEETELADDVEQLVLQTKLRWRQRRAEQEQGERT